MKAVKGGGGVGEGRGAEVRKKRMVAVASQRDPLVSFWCRHHLSRRR